ncbi:MAG: hypothetical protein HKUEN01_32940 [Candidatus Kuenenia stuttgartiensis]|nr:MAG: hypothetical protein HKUEN01_32940 [Candidatus Kuenenia stuttgartiensis]
MEAPWSLLGKAASIISGNFAEQATSHKAKGPKRVRATSLAMGAEFL